MSKFGLVAIQRGVVSMRGGESIIEGPSIKKGSKWFTCAPTSHVSRRVPEMKSHMRTCNDKLASFHEHKCDHVNDTYASVLRFQPLSHHFPIEETTEDTPTCAQRRDMRQSCQYTHKH